jgi:hypothetical protein
MTTNPVIEPELLDQLLANYTKPEDLRGEDGLFKQLKKALIERGLGAEFTEHLGYEKSDPDGRGSGNSRVAGNLGTFERNQQKPVGRQMTDHEGKHGERADKAEVAPQVAELPNGFNLGFVGHIHGDADHSSLRAVQLLCGCNDSVLVEMVDNYLGTPRSPRRPRSYCQSRSPLPSRPQLYFFKCMLLLVESSKVFTQCQEAVCGKRQTQAHRYSAWISTVDATPSLSKCDSSHLSARSRPIWCRCIRNPQSAFSLLVTSSPCIISSASIA